jgi:plasmid stability protein
MARTETLQVRLAPDELAKLRTAAAARGWTMAQLLREMIRQLLDEKRQRPFAWCKTRGPNALIRG